MPKINPVKSYNVPYDAMEPTIASGADVDGDRAYYFQKKPARWDVVVFLAPEVSRLGSDLGKKPVAESFKCTTLINAAAEIYKDAGEIYRPQLYYVKRIVGLPGESIQFTVDGIKINDKLVRLPKHLKSPFASFKKRASHKYGVTPYKVPKDNFFMIGDNANIEVVDSRVCGPVPVANLEAKVLNVL